MVTETTIYDDYVLLADVIKVDEPDTVTPSMVYNRAAELVRHGWTQLCYARTVTGNQVGPLHAEADKWCMFGAVSRAAHDLGFPIMDLPGINNIRPKWNDEEDRTQDEVVAALLEMAKSYDNQGNNANVR